MRKFPLFEAWVRQYNYRTVWLWLFDIDNKNELILQIPYNGDIDRILYFCRTTRNFPRTLNFIYKYVMYGGADNE